jgi:hypothetical protein
LVNALFNFKNIDSEELSMGAKSLIILVIATAIMGTLFFQIGGFASGVVGASVITVATLFGWFDYRATIVIWALLVGIVFLQRGV